MVGSIIFGILMFGVIIFVHELGHFLTAKWTGVGINEFSIGMGPKILSKKGRDGVLYSLRLLPIGGYVSMIGEDEDVDDERALCKKPVWKRFIVMAAGSFMNLFLGFAIMLILVGVSQNIYSTTIEDLRVVDTDGNFLDEYQGLREGDKILKIDNKRIRVQYDYSFTAMRVGREPCDITVLRNGEKLIIENFRFPTFTESGVEFGNPNFFVPEKLEKNIGTVLYNGFFQSVSAVKLVFSSLVDLVSGKYGVEAVSGPVGVIGEIGETAKLGYEALLFLVSIIAINIGIMNLLPLPALDGGRIFFLLIELIRGKPIKPEHEGYVHFAGIVLLLAFMVFVTYNDIIKLITG